MTATLSVSTEVVLRYFKLSLPAVTIPSLCYPYPTLQFFSFWRSLIPFTSISLGNILCQFWCGQLGITLSHFSCQQRSMASMSSGGLGRRSEGPLKAVKGSLEWVERGGVSPAHACDVPSDGCPLRPLLTMLRHHFRIYCPSSHLCFIVIRIIIITLFLTYINFTFYWYIEIRDVAASMHRPPSEHCCIWLGQLHSSVWRSACWGSQSTRPYDEVRAEAPRALLLTPRITHTSLPTR